MKNLFSKSLSKKKVAVIGASFVVFVAAFGFVFYETTKKTVAVTLDGEEKVIKTHAGTIEEVLEELDISLHSEDYVSPSADTKVNDNLKVEWKPAKQVQMVKGNETKQVWTTADTVGAFLKEQKVSLSEHDQVHPTIDTKIKNDLQIKIDKAFSLTLNDGGEEKQVWSTSTTVADFLSQQGITLNELDRVEPKMDEKVQEDAIINVIRVEKVTDVVEEPIKFAVVTKQDSSLTQGTEKTVTSGQEGLLKKEYEVVLENGKEVSRELVKESTLKEKQDKVVAVGTKVIAQTVSRGTNDNVSKEFTVSSTAYTANCNGCSGRTATGFNLKANPNAKIIAVDPSVIPLGTKVYVEGYGYAVAADTGSAIKGNKIDVFFSSKSAAYRWGRKNVKIKILN
ncbi:G5 and 3D domain-containing protein [Robertmurraya massiliosenegalensis]|uniref:G5 and 3D domain-containing protein n=1 Tax=Robertmurraya massiliosenegalensis TaxID=1287657 RepID=UPI0003683126|nr:G5 and 3D domain-containing protein [Robertmurraya massiliosenegalensis]